MSVFYAGELVIYSLSFNDFMPFNVRADVLAKVRKNYFEHNKRQSDKLVQNINDISLKYSYNMENGKPMKWLVQRDKKIIEQAFPQNGGYEISTFDENGGRLITTFFSQDHKLQKAVFDQNGTTVTAEISTSGEQAFINYNIGEKTEVLTLLKTEEEEEVLKRLTEINPFITITALTNYGVVYFGTENEIECVKSIISDIKEQIAEEKKPKVYISEQDKRSGFNFKDADFNIRKNMNTTYDLKKAEIFDGEITEDEQLDIDDKETTAPIESIIQEQFPDDTSSEEPLEAEEVVKESIFGEEIKESAEPSAKVEDNNSDIENLIDEILKERKSAAISKEEKPVTVQEVKPEEKKQAEEIKKEEQAAPEVVLDDPEPDTPEKEPAHRAQNPDAVAPDLIINSAGERYLYFGEISDELAREGYGRTQMKNGRTAYEGEYHKNKRNGFGSFYFRDGGLCYSGEWKENKRSGFGMGKRSSDGSYHVGEWDNNKPNGVGARFDKYGRLSYVANFKNGKETGLCVEYSIDGSITIFKWINDEKKIIQTIYP